MGSADRTLLPVPDAHEPRCGALPRSRMGRRRALVLVLVHVAVLVHVLHWRWSGRSLSPLEPSEAGETLLSGAVNAGFVLLVVALLATLVLGRFFCGWACHVVAYQDLAQTALARIGLRPRPVRSRLLLVVPFLAALSMFVLPPFERFVLDGAPVPPIVWHLTTAALWERFPGPWIAGLTFLVCGGLVVWLLGAKGFCTYACPYGALFGLVGRHAPGRIRVSDACEGCGHCTAVCTSAVRVHAEVARFGQVVDPGCMRCLDCVSACPKDALSFGFARDPRAKAKGRLGFLARLRRPPKEAARWDLSWGEEALAFAVFLGALYALRGLYDLVPFLLALGLAVLVAFGAVTLTRLVRSRDLTVQHGVWRRGGRLTRAGVLGALSIVLALAFTLHSGLFQYESREGTREVERAARLAAGDPSRGTLLASAARHLERAEALALVPSAARENRLGQVLARTNRADAAVAHLERAVALDPGLVSARVELAWVHARRGEAAAAFAALAPALPAAAHDPVFVRTVQALYQHFPDEQSGRALVERIQAAAR